MHLNFVLSQTFWLEVFKVLLGLVWFAQVKQVNSFLTHCCEIWKAYSHRSQNLFLFLYIVFTSIKAKYKSFYEAFMPILAIIILSRMLNLKHISLFLSHVFFPKWEFMTNGFVTFLLHNLYLLCMFFSYGGSTFFFSKMTALLFIWRKFKNCYNKSVKTEVLEEIRRRKY